MAAVMRTLARKPTNQPTSRLISVMRRHPLPSGSHPAHHHQHPGLVGESLMSDFNFVAA